MSNRHDKTHYPNLDTYEAIRALYKLRQGTETSLETNLEHFQIRMEAVKEVTGQVGTEQEHVDALLRVSVIRDLARVTTATRSEEKAVNRKRYLATLFMQSNGHHKYRKVNGGLENHHILKRDNYLNTLTDVCTLLQNYRVPHKVGRVFSSN